MPRKEKETVEAEVVSESVENCCRERKNRGGLFWGLVLVSVGGILIAQTFVDFDFWKYFWPGVVLVLGLSMIFRSFR